MSADAKRLFESAFSYHDMQDQIGVEKWLLGSGRFKLENIQDGKIIKEGGTLPVWTEWDWSV